MRFRLKQIILFISFFGINGILGQEYFSTFLPVNNFSMDARSMAMGGGSPRSVHDPVFRAFGNPLYFSFDVLFDLTIELLPHINNISFLSFLS